MKRIAVLMLVAGLAACSGSKDTPEGDAGESGTAQGGEEVAGESPSAITSIDAATGFAGGMSADTPESALPKPQDRRAKAPRESGPDSDEPIAPEPSLNLTPPAATPAQPAPSNTATPIQPPQ